MKNFDILADKNRALVLGDIHGNYDGFARAVDYAAENDLFIVSLGDLVDYGHDNFDCVDLMSALVRRDAAAMVIGNHDLKFYKWLKQRDEGDIRVQVKSGLIATVSEFENMDELTQLIFISYFREIYASARFHYVTRNTMFIHGGAHRVMWDTDTLNSKGRARATYGQVDGYNEDDYPNRIYDWADEVHEDRTVFFGHDIRSMEAASVVGVNNNVHSMDTGSSKGGKLTGAVIEFDGTKFIKAEEIAFDK